MMIRTMTKDVSSRYAEQLLELYYISMGTFSSNWDESNVTVDLPDKWRYSLVMFSDELVSAFLLASVYCANIVHVHQLSVHPKLKGQGYGKKLIRQLVDISKETGIEAISLESLVQNTEANRFYDKLGFEIISDSESINEYLSNKNKQHKRDEYYPINNLGIRQVYWMSPLG